MSAVDEARLRELAARLRDIRRGEKITSFELRDIHEACALLDSLSAERERGDRAVGLLRPFGRHYDLNDLDEWASDNALEIPVHDLRAVKVFLATQKAEGAQTCCAGGPQWGHAWGCKKLHELG